MSDDNHDGGKTVAFFLGMLVGMLLAAGAAGTFFATQTRRQAMLAEEVRIEAEQARYEVESMRARAEADVKRARAEAAERKAKE